MNVLDLIIVIPLLYFMYKGAVNGLVKELLNIIGMVLAIFLTFNYMDLLNDVIAPLFADESNSIIPFVSASILFVGTLGIVALIAHFTKKFVNAVNLGTVNRIFGALFGFLKSGLFISAILLIIAGFNAPKEELRKESYLYPFIIHLGPGAFNVVAKIYPEAVDYTETINKSLKKYKPSNNLPIISDD